MKSCALDAGYKSKFGDELFSPLQMSLSLLIPIFADDLRDITTIVGGFLLLPDLVGTEEGTEDGMRWCIRH